MERKAQKITMLQLIRTKVYLPTLLLQPEKTGSNVFMKSSVNEVNWHGKTMCVCCMCTFSRTEMTVKDITILWPQAVSSFGRKILQFRKCSQRTYAHTQ